MSFASVTPTRHFDLTGIEQNVLRVLEDEASRSAVLISNRTIFTLSLVFETVMRLANDGLLEHHKANLEGVTDFFKITLLGRAVLKRICPPSH
jgi:hypothetical protein